MSPKWLSFFMKMAFASVQMSKDRTRVGCVIVGENKNVISTGFNGFPKGVNELEIRKLPAYKAFYTCHAEQNALDLAESSVKGAYLFTTHHPCAQCARSIIQKGVKVVFYWHKMENERWKDSMSASRAMLEEAKIPLICLNIEESSSVADETLKIPPDSKTIWTSSPKHLQVTPLLSTEKQAELTYLLERGQCHADSKS